MIKRKIPNVRIVTGNVRITRIGLTMKFKREREMATSTALK